MNDSWKQICQGYVDSYNAIKTLSKNCIVDVDQELALEILLLKDIIVTFESEVNE